MTNEIPGENPTRPLAVRPDMPIGPPVFTRVSDDPDAERSTVIGSVAGLRTLRRTLASWLSELGLDLPDFVADVQLAVVEVVTNSFVHGDAESVTVHLSAAHREVVVVAEHRSLDTATSLPALQPPSTSISGRGLYIVDQIARERTVFHSGGTSTTTLFVPVPVETPADPQLVATGTDV